MGRLAHFARKAVGLAFLNVTLGTGGKGRTVDYEKPEVESQVDVKGIMGWGGGWDKPYPG
jgi:hypothetical protein